MKPSSPPLTRYIAFACAVAALLAHHALAEVKLPRKIMQLAKLTGDITEKTNADPEDLTPCEGCTDYQVFVTPKKWAVVTRTPEGYCLAVFRDSQTLNDWTENLNPGTSAHCGENENGKTTCCTMRKGFKIAYSQVQSQVEDALRACAESCKDPDECVVLGGYSLGGAVAQVAALVSFGDLNPYIVTLAPPQAISPVCSLVSSDRTYGLINTFTNGTGLTEVKDDYVGLVYDVVPFLVPGIGASPLGKLFLLSDDDSSVAFLGQDSLPKEILTGHFAIDVHFLTSYTREGSGYLGRINPILDALVGDDSVNTAGFSAGNTCNFAFECESGECASHKCT